MAGLASAFIAFNDLPWLARDGCPLRHWLKPDAGNMASAKTEAVFPTS
jgi:hypothetical protein